MQTQGQPFNSNTSSADHMYSWTSRLMFTFCKSRPTITFLDHRFINKYRLINLSCRLINLEYRLMNLDYRLMNLDYRLMNLNYRLMNLDYRLMNLE